MSNETSKAGAVQPADHIGTRPRRPSESTYGLANHEDGVQSGDLTGGDSADPALPDDGNTSRTGPGATHSNGMKGQQ